MKAAGGGGTPGGGWRYTSGDTELLRLARRCGAAELTAAPSNSIGGIDMRSTLIGASTTSAACPA